MCKKLRRGFLSIFSEKDSKPNNLKPEDTVRLAPKANDLKPGDKVRITQNAWLGHIMADDYGVFCASKGSTAVVVSFEEFWDYYLKNATARYFEYSPEQVKKWIDEGTSYPMKFVTVTSPDDSRPIDENLYQVGVITVLEERFWQKIE